MKRKKRKGEDEPGNPIHLPKGFSQTNYNPIAARLTAHSGHQMLALVFFHHPTPTRHTAAPRAPPASPGMPRPPARPMGGSPRAPTVATAPAPSRAMAATRHGDPHHGLRRPPRPHARTVIAGWRAVSRPPPVKKVVTPQVFKLTQSSVNSADSGQTTVNLGPHLEKLTNQL
jgi:hypothetical protein